MIFGKKLSRRSVLRSSALGLLPALHALTSPSRASSRFRPAFLQLGRVAEHSVRSPFNELPRCGVEIDAGQVVEPFEWRRHCLSHGGINTHPLPGRVIEGAKRLDLPLLRTFMQEYLNVYPAHGQFDWSIADPYMQSLAATGAKVVAAPTMKPTPLFPEVDESIWRATDRGEWQDVISAVAKRYSVDQPIVTYWEIGNETDIGEWGGSPMLVDSVDDYFEYYRTHVEAIQRVAPGVKIGGTAVANPYAEWVPGFLDRCRETGTQLDFVSWHQYNSSPTRHADIARHYEELVADFPTRPELFVTEWSKGFEQVSVEEMAFESHRAAHVAATILEMMGTALDRSFYYHVWDQTNYGNEFERFFSKPEYMGEHWNEKPHRFGLFGVEGKVRPQYFVYQMLGRMGEETLHASTNQPGLRVKSVKGENKISTMLVNFDMQPTQELVVSLNFTDLTRGPKMLRTYRIDNEHRWDAENLELLPYEEREVYAFSEFTCQVYSPPGTVSLLVLEDL